MKSPESGNIKKLLPHVDKERHEERRGNWLLMKPGESLQP